MTETGISRPAYAGHKYKCKYTHTQIQIQIQKYKYKYTKTQIHKYTKLQAGASVTSCAKPPTKEMENSKYLKRYDVDDKVKSHTQA